jgi:Domain of unknown function (DUF5666)
MEATTASDSTEAAGRAPKGGSGVSRTFAIVGIVVALAIGGIVGVAVGWKVEQNRVKDDVKNVRPVGQVTAVNGNTVTVRLTTSSGTRTYVLTDSTKFDTTRSGKAGDITKGATVLVKSKRGSNGKLQATEVIILPQSSSFKK